MRTTKDRNSARTFQMVRLRPQPTRWLNLAAAQRIRLPDRKSVLAYCREHPYLARELPAIAARAREVFGTRTLSLELYRDPEIEDRYLTLAVRTTSHDPALTDRIEALNHELHDGWDDDLGYLLVMPDHRKPRAANGG